MGVSNGHVADDVTHVTHNFPQRCCDAVRSAILVTAWLLVWTTPYTWLWSTCVLQWYTLHNSRLANDSCSNWHVRVSLQVSRVMPCIIRI